MSCSAVVFLSGICAATFIASAVFFLKFWRTSRDSFFVWFALACLMIAFERMMTLFVEGTNSPLATPVTEANSWIYLIRLGAFLIISVAIIDKNRKAS